MCFFRKRKKAQPAQAKQEEVKKVEPKPEEPVKPAEPAKVEPKKVEPKPAEPKKAEAKPAPKKVEPKKEEPVTEEPVKEESTRAQKYHISLNNDEKSEFYKQWRVRKSGSKKTIKYFKTQKEAIDYAKTLAKNADTDIVIHRTDGRIRKQKY
ncbi:MAG: DUF2188 domain-containing protein [Acholeplasmataceae bacterium]|jgi:hypothetical protein